jgi:hypothetical protein
VQVLLAVLVLVLVASRISPAVAAAYAELRRLVAGAELWLAWVVAVVATAGIELSPEAQPASCRIGAPCSAKWIDEFGYVTLPVLGLTAFAAIAALLLLAWFRPAER